jgi:hypothetical protein
VAASSSPKRTSTWLSTTSARIATPGSAAGARRSRSAGGRPRPARRRRRGPASAAPPTSEGAGPAEASGAQSPPLRWLAGDREISAGERERARQRGRVADDGQRAVVGTLSPCGRRAQGRPTRRRRSGARGRRRGGRARTRRPQPGPAPGSRPRSPNASKTRCSRSACAQTIAGPSPSAAPRAATSIQPCSSAGSQFNRG